AASNRSIDEVRELIERAAYKPTVGRFKVFMIDEAHQLTKDAFNALLKTLEEPPEYLKFVLATTDPEKMLPTVLSRCLQFNLRPMAPQTVAEYVGQVLQAEQIAADAGALRLIGRAARGSMRDALSLTDQAIAYGGGKLEEDAVRAMLGAVDRRHAQRLVVALAQRNGREVLAQCDGLRSQGLSAAGTLEEMARLLQQMAVEQTVPGALDATDPDTEAARELAPHLAADETQLLYSMVLHGRAELSLAPDEYAGLVMVLLRFLAFPPQESASRGNAAPVAARSPAPVMLPPPPPPLAAPVAAPVAVPLPPPTPVPMAAPVPAPVPPPPAPTPSVRASTPPDDDGPPPWMDEAPLPGEVIGRAPVRAASPAVPAPPPVPVPAPVAPPVVATVVATVQPLTTSPLGDHWAGLVMRLVSEAGLSAMARELALQAQLVAWPENDTDDWQLQVERDTLLLPALSDKLAQCLTQLLGRPQRVQVRQGAVQDSPARRAEALLRQRQHQAEQAIHDDVLVQVLLEQFSTARIVPGSIRPA
ncbi:MAG: hypothetical protein RLZZ494_1241, partial [Pseudomonadota bacterium]